jgi:hypothetical protein
VDSPPVFDSAEHAFNDIALFVERLVIGVLDLAVFARRDDWLGAAFDQPFAQGFAVVALVGDQLGRWRHRFDAGLSGTAIVNVSGG